MSELLLPKISPAIEAFQKRSGKFEWPNYFIPSAEKRADVLWLSKLPATESFPEAAICLSHDLPNKNSKYYLDVQQHIGTKHLPVVSLDFTTDNNGNLTQLDKLHYWVGEYLLEYKRDQITGQKAYLASMKRNKNDIYEEVNRAVHFQLLQQSVPATPLNAVDWTDVILTYITEKVHKNGKSTEKKVDSEVVAKKPLISYFSS